MYRVRFPTSPILAVSRTICPVASGVSQSPME